MKKTNKHLEKLWQKFSTNTSNRKEFEEWYDVLLNKNQDKAISPLLKKKWDDLLPETSRNKLRRQWYYSAAATVLLCLGFATLFLIQQGGTSQNLSEQTVATLDFSLPAVTLPDGSTVTLQEGSRLNLKNNFLSGNTREVILEGEAFFDIAHNADKPFIIHTGNIKTTVLGTVFAIKAKPGESSVTITVVEGKVKVEDGETLLAILEADQQFIYGIGSDFWQEKSAEAEIDWTSHELIFRNMLFGDVAHELAVRYDVNIVIENEELKQRRIGVLLDGRNPIETLLESLCTWQQATHTLQGNTYIIKPNTKKL